MWTVVPEWVVEKLQAAPHDSSKYFFWSGEGKMHTRASKWLARLRRLLDLAGFPHRTRHNFRHRFAIEHLLSGTPIEDVSRLLGHKESGIPIRTSAWWRPTQIAHRHNQRSSHEERVNKTIPFEAHSIPKNRFGRSKRHRLSGILCSAHPSVHSLDYGLGNAESTITSLVLMIRVSDNEYPRLIIEQSPDRVGA